MLPGSRVSNKVLVSIPDSEYRALATLRIVYRQLQKVPLGSRLRSPGTGMD
jgi:hypothetical protein